MLPRKDDWIYFSFLSVSTIDDPMLGISLVVCVSGCPRQCEGCHTPHLQNVEYGKLINTSELMCKIKYQLSLSSDLIDNIVFLGGEPLLYPLAIHSIITQLNEYRTILYTGYDYDDVPDYIKNDVDILKTGEWVEDLESNKFPASTNQEVYINNKLLTNEELNNLPINMR